MSVEARHITAAQAILTRIAFARGEDADPVETLRLWRRTEGIADDALEVASLESAQSTIEEIEAIIADGGDVSLGMIREFLRREFEAAWQVGWICRARRDAHSDEDVVREAAEQAASEVSAGGG